MKLSVFTVATPELTPEQLAAAAKQAGIQGVEWRYKEAPEGAETMKPSFWGNNICTIFPSGGEELADRFGRAAEANGLSTISVTPYLQAGDLAETENVLRTARRLGASYIRLGVPGYDRTKPFNELFELERAYLREAAELCGQYGVKGLVETHHVTIAPSASAAYRLVEGLNPDQVGVLYDPGNMVYEGFENYRMGLELLGPYLAHVHVKNAAWKPGDTREDGAVAWNCSWTGMKAGIVDWKQVIQDLKAIGYDGYLGVEDFSQQYEQSADMLQAFAGYMRELLEA
ncbi:sugar phosphate isomerase/epimerase family protein [Paenibacillus protaetiae]|uniref:Sugar phosphate isomerase/epimerase n=1 Tax=Paenibacillus protaetiae TaxID=2509456 RepID=A0A4P6EYL3_9BACL|nr:sugar phosphate isomerase/epimerase family protein [Paenibacillus protaetiae]QAY68174.1 sugar phosphate isomerase/epimerase [Paenibacillus protaetiae]